MNLYKVTDGVLEKVRFLREETVMRDDKPVSVLVVEYKGGRIGRARKGFYHKSEIAAWEEYVDDVIGTIRDAEAQIKKYQEILSRYSKELMRNVVVNIDGTPYEMEMIGTSVRWKKKKLTPDPT